VNNTNSLEVQQIKPPQRLLTELHARQLKYTEPLVLLNMVYVMRGIVGVFGDPDSLAYEWFIANDDGSVAETSNDGWGWSEDALLAGLKKAGVGE
jgi:hypothetical protein